MNRQSPLVLSLFPGIGLLDMAFEEQGFSVVRGPDLLWGGDIRSFHVPEGRFEGVIGGPPCQLFSAFRHINPHVGKHGNQIPEYERVVAEARPTWFVMENVTDAPLPAVDGYIVKNTVVNNRWLGEEQDRTRRFSFGTLGGQRLGVMFAALETPLYARAITSSKSNVPVAMVRDGKGGHKIKASLRPPTVTGGHGAAFAHERGDMSIARMIELQGPPPDFLSEAPFTAHGKRKVLGNGVPLPMGRAIAKAVWAAMYPDDTAGVA